MILSPVLSPGGWEGWDSGSGVRLPRWDRRDGSLASRLSTARGPCHSPTASTSLWRVATQPCALGDGSAPVSNSSDDPVVPTNTFRLFSVKSSDREKCKSPETRPFPDRPSLSSKRRNPGPATAPRLYPPVHFCGPRPMRPRFRRLRVSTPVPSQSVGEDKVRVLVSRPGSRWWETTVGIFNVRVGGS